MGQKSKAFAAMGVTDIFALPGHREFYHALASQRDFVHVSRLDVGAQTAAANLGLVFRGSYYHLLASYDGGEMSKYGPGSAHLHDLIRYAIERGCGAFDFTIGDERYKATGATARSRCTTTSPRRHCAARRWRCGSIWCGRLKRWIKQTPALWNAAYKVRAFIGPLMRRIRA